MSQTMSSLPNSSLLRQQALSTWENEGGPAIQVASDGDLSGNAPSDLPTLTNSELVQLRVRVIALENLMITVLAQASNRQLERAREMAAYISPRPGSAHHPLTMRAAEHMTRLVDRAPHFRDSAITGEPE